MSLWLESKHDWKPLPWTCSLLGTFLKLSYQSGPDIRGSETVFQLLLTQGPKQTGTDNIRLVLPHVIQERPSIWYQCGSFCISNLLQRNLLLHPSKICKTKNWHFFILSRIPNSINTKRNHNLIGQYFSRDFSSPNLDLDTLRIFIYLFIYICQSCWAEFCAEEIIHKFAFSRYERCDPSIWCVCFVFRGTEPKKHKHKTEYNQNLHLGKLQFGATWKVEAWKLVVAVADADVAAEIA